MTRPILMLMPAVMLFASSVLNYAPTIAQSPPVKKKVGDFRAQYIKKVDFPGIPPYPGANKLIRAVQLPKLGKGNITIMQSWLVRDEPQKVRDFYAQQLASNNWNPKTTNKGNTQLVGHREGNENCQVMINPGYAEGYKTMLQIRYTKSETSIN